MASDSLPSGMGDVDYEAIEAAVTETVRGRWFLKEFARRNRGAEVQVMLDAMSRLETLVTTQAALPAPSADPSIRLLVQRIKDIAGRLDGVALTMREDGLEPRFCDAVAREARAVAGLMRPGSPVAAVDPVASVTERRMLPASPPKPEAAQAVTPSPRAPLVSERPRTTPTDARLAALSGLDDLPMSRKLALFT